MRAFRGIDTLSALILVLVPKLPVAAWINKPADTKELAAQLPDRTIDVVAKEVAH